MNYLWRAYQGGKAMTMAACVVLMVVVVREGVPGAVGLYALWCAVAAFLAFAFADAPECREQFYRFGWRCGVWAFAVFLAWEGLRWARGRMTAPEGVAAAALILAFCAGAAMGERAPASAGRVWAQCAGVALALLVAAALLSAGSLRGPLRMPAGMLSGLPRPPEWRVR